MSPALTNEISFFIPGDPRSTQTGSVRRITRPGQKDRLIVSRRGTAWSAWCQAAAVKAHRPAPPLEGPVSVYLVFHLREPKSGRPIWTAKPDVGNLEKGLLDAWQGVLWVDDAQVVQCTTSKQWATGDRPGVSVTIWPSTAPTDG